MLGDFMLKKLCSFMQIVFSSAGGGGSTEKVVNAEAAFNNIYILAKNLKLFFGFVLIFSGRKWLKFHSDNIEKMEILCKFYFQILRNGNIKYLILCISLCWNNFQSLTFVLLKVAFVTFYILLLLLLLYAIIFKSVPTLFGSLADDFNELV